jgi:hypothetical protein
MVDMVSNGINRQNNDLAATKTNRETVATPKKFKSRKVARNFCHAAALMLIFRRG